MPWSAYILPRSFYLRDTVTVARALLGAYVVRELDHNVVLVGKIVETEAYLPHSDAAAHGYRGITSRNRSMFMAGGHAYVHTMRHHALLDIVAETIGVPGGVLVRALEPIEGVATMMQLRGMVHTTQLTNGPGKLCQAFAITKALDGVDLTHVGNKVFIARARERQYHAITTTRRIGITKAADLPLRFYLTNNPYVSRSGWQ